MQPAPNDQRRKLVSLSTRGQELLAYSKQSVWPRIEAAVAELCSTLDAPLLDQLTAIEDGLAKAPLARRGLRPEKEES